MSYAVIDVETTIFQRGNPFSARNRLCLVGVRIDAINTLFEIEYDQTAPYGENLSELRRLVNSVDTVVLFNAKFDLNWLARYGITLTDSQKVFDCQLAEFILGHQRPSYPSLDDCLAKYNLGEKLHVVEQEYWANDIDTPDIPLSILTEYLNEDLRLTDALYNKQLDTIPEGQTRLISLACADLRVLQEMEFNGQRISWDTLADAALSAEAELKELDERIRNTISIVEARDIFNIDSGDHLSCLLYGGCIRGKRGTPYQRIFKSGARSGETTTANRWEAYEYTFERLVKPIDGSELKKDGYYSTDEETLLSLSKPKALISLLLRRAEVAKLYQTYLVGLPKIAAKYDWQDDLIHGTLNQCRTITGRISSEKPNKQNFPEIINQYIVSQF